MVGDGKPRRGVPRSVTSLPSDDKRPLQSRLMDAREENMHSESTAFFYPRSVFSYIITEASVAGELRRVLPEKKEEAEVVKLARDICAKTVVPAEDGKGRRRPEPKIRCFKRIFALLVLVKKTLAITDFMAAGVNDSDLPLEQVRRLDARKLFDLSRRSEPDKPLRKLFGEWDDGDMELFWERQWTVISPFLALRAERYKVWHYRLKPRVVLPFCQCSTHPVGATTDPVHSGFSHVFRVAIHPWHHNFQYSAGEGPLRKRESYSGLFAMKRLKSSTRQDFDQEVRMLRRCSQDKHAHLVSLLATYEHHGQFFLLFDWAECNLKEYWEKYPDASADDHAAVAWTADQCAGIASGIRWLHTAPSINRALQPGQQAVAGHHGDVKGENILWFPARPVAGETVARRNTGVLKLADFGLSAYGQYGNTSSVDGEARFIASPSFRAPESDANWNRA